MVMKFFGSLLLVASLVALGMALPTPGRQEEDPELTAGYFEGDMVLDAETRNGLINEKFRWPDNIVYYSFHTQFDEAHFNHIMRGMQILEEVSCIRFHQANETTKNFVNITGFPEGCFSSVGFLNKGAQNYNLQLYPLDEGCFRLGTVVHEFLHTLGFYHMQSASNRDDYVRIAEENIKPETLHNFAKHNNTVVDDFDTKYDYESVLHYGPYAFSANGEMTIIALHDDQAASNMGQRRGMTQSDINKLNTMYRCPVKV